MKSDEMTDLGIPRTNIYSGRAGSEQLYEEEDLAADLCAEVQGVPHLERLRGAGLFR